MGYYIHNIYKNMSAGDISSQFGLEKIKQQAEVALTQVRALNQQFKQEVETKTQGLVQYEEVMEFLERSIGQAAATSMQQLQAISGAAVREAIDNAMAAQGTSNFQAAITEMSNQFANLRRAFESFARGYETATAAINKDTPLGQAYSSNKTTLDRAYRVVMDTLNDSAFKRLAGGGFGSKDNLSSLRGYVSKIATGGLFSKNEGEKGVSPAAAIGFLAEGVYGNALKDLFSSMSFGDGKYQLQATATGAESGYAIVNGKQVGFAAKTSDISIQLTNKEGTMTINLPGISLKRTGAFQRGQNGNIFADIHVKTSNLGNMLNTAQVKDDMQSHVYNLIANNGRAAKIVENNDGTIGETYQHPNINLNDMYRWIYAATLLASFAGNLTMSDFANFWVVNDKVYTAPEIIIAAFKGSIPAGHAGHHAFAKYLEDASKSGIAKSAASIPKKHSEIFDNLLSTSLSMEEQSRRRSQQIMDAMTGIPYSMHLRVSINALLGY